MAAQPLPVQSPELTGNDTEKELGTEEGYSFVVRHSALKGYQAASLVTPPGYAAYALYKKRLTLSRLLRVSWVGGVVGYAIGGALAVAKLSSATQESIDDRAARLRYNESQVRVDGMSMVGGWVTGIITPALFWRHARLVDLALGGATLGVASGVYAHLWMSYREKESIKPEGMRDIITPEKQ